MRHRGGLTRRTTAAVRGCQAAWGAALDIDDPDGPRMTGQVLAAWLRQGFIGDPAEAWLIPGAVPGSVAGWYRLELPDLENLDRAGLLIVVDPAARRQGLGRDLLRHAARAGRRRRAVRCSVARSGTARQATRSPPRSGRSRGCGEVRRLDLRTVPAGKFAPGCARGGRRRHGILAGPLDGADAAEYLESLARGAERLRRRPARRGLRGRRPGTASGSASAPTPRMRAMGVRTYTIAAVHDASGELAAMTQLSVAPDHPGGGIRG